MRGHPFLVALGLVAAASAAAQAPQRLLADGDVGRFIRDFKSLSAELEALGQKVDINAENAVAAGALLEALRASAEAQRILRKYGWGDALFQKYSTILLAHFVVKLERARLEAGGEIAAQLAEIDRNPGLTVQQKAALKAQLGAVAQAVGETEAAYRAQIHAADLEAVRAHEAALDALFDQ